MSNFFEKSKRGRGRAKHAILDQYLKAFFAIQCQCKTWNDPILYIDGFAGPGTYVSADENANEEIGSPIVAYKAASEHSLIDNFRRLGNKILLIFVEKDKEKSKRLQRKLQELERETEDSVKEIVEFTVVNNDFVSFMEYFLQRELQNLNSPMFVFADPFGFYKIHLVFTRKLHEFEKLGKLIPMRLLKRLLERQNNGWLPTEVFITVMDGFARRFITDARKSSALNDLMGKDNWHHLTQQGHLTPAERRNQFIDLYINNLKADETGIRNALALKFAMRDNRNRHIYHLIYLTGHIRGIQKMKTAMWKKTQTSTEMVFSEWVENRNNDGNDGGNIVDKDKNQVAQRLSELIKTAFWGQRVVSGANIDNYIWLDTPYVSNVKNELKKLLKPFAINNERALENIVYRFIDSNEGSTKRSKSDLK